jgi:hypothetical protein
MSLHRLSLYLLYGLTIASITLISATGGEYWALSKAERPHHPLHAEWKPSGVISHGLGIIGSLMVLILLLYSVRKQWRFMQNWGSLRYWLNYHIWLGITGPILVLFHTTFKFGGIVSVSFWSMTAVVLSGIIGRYIYVQIPRSITGQELSHGELEALDRELIEQIRQTRGIDEETIRLIQQASSAGDARVRTGWGAVWDWLINDLTMGSQLSKVRVHLHASREFTPAEVKSVLKLARKKLKLRRKIAFLATAHRLLHHWHIFHKPFAIVMILIMFVHVGVTIIFGYRWIF